MQDASALYRLLGDDARLRLLRLLALDRLNVTELTSILGIAQSGVSRHLGLLRDGGLVSEEREGGFTYYRVAAAVRDGRNGAGPLWALLESQFAGAAATEAGRADLARLEEVRRVRKENFDVHAGPDTQRASAGARAQLGGVGAGPRPPAASGPRGRSRLRRGLPDGRDEPLGVARDCRRSIGGSPEARAHARVAAARSPT